MATIFGTANNDSWTVVKALTFTLDGLGGTDTVYLGTSLRTQYTIVGNADGSVTVDTLSGASAALHAVLYNIEFLKFDSGRDFIDLTTFTNDTTPPTVTSFSPANGAFGAGLGNNIVLTFNETIQRGVGSIVLKNAAGAVIETFDAATSSKLTLYSGSLSIHPSNSFAFGTKYSVEFAPGTIKDLAGNTYAGTSNYSFTTTGTSVATSGNDMLAIFPGNNTVDGGAGIDTAMLAGLASAYAFSSQSRDGITVSGSDGIHSLVNVERLQFSDLKFAFDLSGSAGNAAKLIGAAFGIGYLSPAYDALKGVAINAFDSGQSMQQLAALVVGLDMFQQMVGGTRSNADFVNFVYKNVVGTLPSAGDLNSLVGLLNGSMSQADLLVLAANASINEQHVNLVGLSVTGLEYV